MGLVERRVFGAESLYFEADLSLIEVAGESQTFGH
jgi:hypothetical protein